MTDRPLTNRNFSGPNNARNPKGINLIQIFIFTLLFLAVGLLFSAIYLSQQLDLNNNNSRHSQTNKDALSYYLSDPRADRGFDANALSTNNGGSTDGNVNRQDNLIANTENEINLQSAAIKSQLDTNPALKSPTSTTTTTTTTDFSNFKQYPKDRLYCMIPFIWNPPIYNAIMSTWGQRCDTIHFLTDAMVSGHEFKGDHFFTFDNSNTNNDASTSTTTDDAAAVRPYWEYPPNTFPPNVKFINMTRSWENCQSNKGQKVCRHIWEKMWRSWVYVEQHHLHDAEWFCKIDYDTFFFPDNFKYYVRDVRGWDPINEHHYFGHVIQHRNRKDRPMVVGASACWSQRTLKEIAQVYRDMPKGSNKGERGKCEDRSHATEEVTTSVCLKDHLNIVPEAARDDQMREYITIDKYPMVLTWNRTEQGEWWYWKGKPQNAGQMENTIARRPIGIHKYKNEKEILTLWEEFYGPSGNQALVDVGRKRHGDVARRFVEEVRREMGIDPS